jgi:hypothetical protein
MNYAAEVSAEFKKVWGKDEKMVDFCVKSTSGVVKFEEGGYYLFRKPSIQTRFCFGYGQNGISSVEEFESACEARKQAETKEAFIRENMYGFEDLEETFNFDGPVYIVEDYDGKNGCMLRSLRTEEYKRRWNSLHGTSVGELSETDKENLKKELKAQKKAFMKRLETYWKRYGSSKLKTWTYLVD